MDLSLVQTLSRRLGPRALHDALSPDERVALRYLWPAWARPNQLAPLGDWFTWLVLAGRGFGKTRSGAEWVLQRRRRFPGLPIGAVGATADETRKVMFFGESGIVARCPPWDRPHWNVTDQSLDWPDGTRVFALTADKPDLARGFQFATLWLDELAKWRRMKETYDNLMMALRLSTAPQCCITTTPRPLQLLRKIADDKRTVVTRGSTIDNAANMPKAWLEKMLADYGGTSLGQQELNGELFNEMPGALWQRTWIDAARMTAPVVDADAVLAWLSGMIGEPMRRIVVGVDPATTSNEESDECGIVVVGMGRAPDPRDDREHAYVLEDGTEKLSPDQWARKVVGLVARWGADCVVAETTLGGETIPALIRFADDTVKVIEKGGNRGKRTRAEPIAALYEQGRVHHVKLFSDLEAQMCEYTLDTRKSPNNLDACVHATGELILQSDVGVYLA